MSTFKKKTKKPAAKKAVGSNGLSAKKRVLAKYEKYKDIKPELYNELKSKLDKWL